MARNAISSRSRTGIKMFVVEKDSRAIGDDAISSYWKQLTPAEASCSSGTDGTEELFVHKDFHKEVAKKGALSDSASLLAKMSTYAIRTYEFCDLNNVARSGTIEHSRYYYDYWNMPLFECVQYNVNDIPEMWIKLGSGWLRNRPLDQSNVFLDDGCTEMEYDRFYLSSRQIITNPVVIGLRILSMFPKGSLDIVSYNYLSQSHKLRQLHVPLRNRRLRGGIASLKELCTRNVQFNTKLLPVEEIIVTRNRYFRNIQRDMDKDMVMERAKTSVYMPYSPEWLQVRLSDYNVDEMVPLPELRFPSLRRVERAFIYLNSVTCISTAHNSQSSPLSEHMYNVSRQLRDAATVIFPISRPNEYDFAIAHLNAFSADALSSYYVLVLYLYQLLGRTARFNHLLGLSVTVNECDVNPCPFLPMVKRISSVLQRFCIDSMMPNYDHYCSLVPTVHYDPRIWTVTEYLYDDAVLPMTVFNCSPRCSPSCVCYDDDCQFPQHCLYCSTETKRILCDAHTVATYGCNTLNDVMSSELENFETYRHNWLLNQLNFFAMPVGRVAARAWINEAMDTVIPTVLRKHHYPNTFSYLRIGDLSYDIEVSKFDTLLRRCNGEYSPAGLYLNYISNKPVTRLQIYGMQDIRFPYVGIERWLDVQGVETNVLFRYIPMVTPTDAVTNEPLSRVYNFDVHEIDLSDAVALDYLQPCTGLNGLTRVYKQSRTGYANGGTMFGDWSKMVYAIEYAEECEYEDRNNGHDWDYY